ncbi:DNA repair protein RecO [Companilactobacillus sp. RD055328]|uniref:DNA repair protein RecO n=1 Tax=Companilactobacillus sp. RD055328 TaxID=2916634 RepID=UPI001FC8B6F3|nr:DNA repair protein RecO [Companilactobacillus sp. RD055328]GKQ42661.1 DNA repair protein RecO [Companilactobacillus sp. RD055328]
MSLIKDQTFDGLVLKVNRYKENDALVYMITRQFGLKTFYIRGFGKAKSKLTGALMPFNYGEYIGSISDDGFSYISSANHVDEFGSISLDIKKNAYASFIVDLFSHAFEQQVNIDEYWFDYIKKALSLISEDLDPQIVSNIVQINLLKAFGVEPNFRSCVVGGETEGTFDFSIVLGGIICSHHFINDPNRIHAGQRVIYYLRLFSNIELNNINTIDVKINTKNQIQHVIDMIYDDTVGINLKSKKFIEQLNDF